ncbi:MAG: phosphate ABC transporter substrate-binding protein [Eubacteriales bacterium]|nr:phosphate ABC transporter substrate-binding protein [Eubacteriales bacterium]
MKKQWRIVLMAGVTVLILLGWAIWSQLKPQTSYHTLLIGGSSTVHPYAEALAQAYTEAHPDFKIHCVTGGSTPGLLAVANDAIDLATMSRDLTEDEDGANLKNYLIGRDGLGFIVHPDNPVQNLSLAQLEAILAGEITDWSALAGISSTSMENTGAIPEPIQIISSPVDSNTFTIASDLLLLGEELPASTVYAADAADVQAKVAADPNAIGLVCLHEANASSRFLTINQVRISRETLLTLRYPLTHSFYLVLNLQHDRLSPDPATSNLGEWLLRFFKLDSEQLVQIRSEAILDFVDFVCSRDGQQVIESLGAVSVY